MRHDVLLELAQELFGFGEGESQLLDLLTIFLQYHHFMDRVRSSIIGTNDQLHLYPHTPSSPLGLLPMELTLPSVKGYPRFLMRSRLGAGPANGGIPVSFLYFSR